MLFHWLTVKPGDGRFVYLIKTMITRFIDHNVSRVSGQLAYFILLSMFPFLIFLNALIGSFHIPADRVVEFLRPFFPTQIVNLISGYIVRISQNQSMSLLSIGIVIAIFSASKAVRSLSYAINTAYGMRESENFLIDVISSMLYVIGAGIIVLIVSLFVTLSRDFLTEVIQVNHMSDMLVSMLNVWRWVTLCVILFLVLGLMYKMVPNKKVRFLSVIPGTVLALLGFLGLTIGFSLYVNYFLKSSIFYGSIGAIILLLLWIYIASIILVMGAELNSSLEQMPHHKKKKLKAGRGSHSDEIPDA